MSDKPSGIFSIAVVFSEPRARGRRRGSFHRPGLCRRGRKRPLIIEVQDWNRYLGDGVNRGIRHSIEIREGRRPGDVAC